jgi:hypothetical protein
MLERVLANQAKAEADRKAWREEIEARTKAFEAETEAIRARTKARQVKMMEGNFTTSRKETVA